MSAYRMGHVAYIFPRQALLVLCSLLGSAKKGEEAPRPDSPAHLDALFFLEEEGYIQQNGASFTIGESAAFLAALYAKGRQVLRLEAQGKAITVLRHQAVWLMVDSPSPQSLRLMPLPGPGDALEELLERLMPLYPLELSLQPGTGPVRETAQAADAPAARRALAPYFSHSTEE